MVDPKHSPLLKTTPYVGSATNRVVHRTDSDCPGVRDIPPNERWYIKDIPHDGNYVLCAFCFPQRDADGNPIASENQEAEESKKLPYRAVGEVFTPASVITPKAQQSRKKASRLFSPKPAGEAEPAAAKKAPAVAPKKSAAAPKTKRVEADRAVQAKTGKASAAGGAQGKGLAASGKKAGAKNGKALSKTGKGNKTQR